METIVLCERNEKQFFLIHVGFKYQTKILLLFFLTIGFSFAYGQKIIDSCFTFNNKGIDYDFSDGDLHKSKFVVCSWSSIQYFKNNTIVGENQGGNTYYSHLKKIKCKNKNEIKGVITVNTSQPVTDRYKWKELFKKYGHFPSFTALKLSTKIGNASSTTIKIPFTYASIYPQKIFEPEIYSNSEPELFNAHFIGSLKETVVSADSSYWQTDTLYINIESKLSADDWIIIHSAEKEDGDKFYLGNPGVILCPCCHVLINENIYKRDTLINSSTNIYKYNSLLESERKMVLQNINFKYNDYHLLDGSFKELDSLVEFLNTNQKVKIKVIGYTDDIGLDSENLDLSKNRAKAVYEYLIQKGINKGRLDYSGKGKENPIYPNTNEENRAKNRRVELEILK